MLAYFSSFRQLREMHIIIPLKQRTHMAEEGERARERFGLITLSLESAVTSWPWLQRFRAVMISQALIPLLRARALRELVSHKFGCFTGSILAARRLPRPLGHSGHSEATFEGPERKGQRHLRTKGGRSERHAGPEGSRALLSAGQSSLRQASETRL